MNETGCAQTESMVSQQMDLLDKATSSLSEAVGRLGSRLALVLQSAPENQPAGELSKGLGTAHCALTLKIDNNIQAINSQTDVLHNLTSRLEI